MRTLIARNEYVLSTLVRKGIRDYSTLELRAVYLVLARGVEPERFERWSIVKSLSQRALAERKIRFRLRVQGSREDLQLTRKQLAVVREVKEALEGNKKVGRRELDYFYREVFRGPAKNFDTVLEEIDRYYEALRTLYWKE